MTTAVFKLMTCTALGLACARGVAHDVPDMDAFRLANNIAPLLDAPNPVANVWYLGTWNWLPEQGALRAAPKEDTRRKGRVNYCVVAEVRITPRATEPSALLWEKSFNLELVNAAGAPAAPDFRAVAVPTPIPVNTTRRLEPMPKWCATVPDARKPPEIYLQVGGKKARVQFSEMPNMRDHGHPPRAVEAPASSAR
jgi:hypothetical protein